VGFGDPGVLRAVAAAGVAMTAIALLGLGLGGITRHTAGAIIALPAVLYLPLAILNLPSPWNHTIGRFGMLAATYQLVSPQPHAGLLPAPIASLVMLAWPAAALTAAAVLTTRRDT
jgi:ABC-2 type transport system permease protein